MFEVEKRLEFRKECIMPELVNPSVYIQFSAWPQYHATYHLQILVFHTDRYYTIQSIDVTGYKKDGNLVFDFGNPPWISPNSYHSMWSTNTDRNMWVWYRETPNIWMEPTGPYLVNRSYCISDLDLHSVNLVTNERCDRSIPGVSCNNPITIPIVVPQYKVNWASEASVKYTLAWGLYANAAAWGWCWWVAGPIAVAATIALGLAIDAHGKAKGCADFMEDYKELGDYKKRLKDHEIEDKEEMREFKKFVTTLDLMTALRDTIVDTRNRYLTALKMQDDKVAQKQKEHAVKLGSRVEESLDKLEKHWPKVEDSLTQGFERAKKEPGFKKGKDKAEGFKAVGLSKDDRDFLAGKGLEKAQIDHAEKFAREVTADDLTRNHALSIRPVFDLAKAVSDESAREVEEINRVDSLILNDKLRLLLKEDMITQEEYAERRDDLEQETGYPVWEIWSIGMENSSRLVEAGINTTDDLVGRCAKGSDRKELAKELGVDVKSVDHWALAADMMRVKGVGLEYQILLADLGIKSVSDLARENPETLFKKLSKHIEKVNWGGKPPTSESVAKWVENAKDAGESVSGM